MDCGPGTLHSFDRHGVEWRDLTHILVTHYHADHVGDLASLLLVMAFGAGERGPLTLVGPVGFEGFMGRLARARGEKVLRPGFDVVIRESEPGVELDCGTFGVASHPTPHTDESLAYRVSGGWGAVGYTGDTGPSSEVGSFLRGVDVLIAECSMPDTSPPASHLSPRSLAELAALARPELLVVTHVYPELGAAEAVRRTRALYDGEVIAGEDGLRVAIGPNGPTLTPRPAAPK